MLTKVFRREFIPGTPGSPGVEGGWVCHTPGGGGQWVYECESRQHVLKANTGIEIPPGATVTYHVNDDGDVVATITTCYSKWVPNPDAPDPVCVYVEPVAPVPSVPPRWEVSPIVGWDAGANSVQVIEGDCEAKWTMGMVVGAHIGLTDDREDVTSPERLSHAFYFHQRAGVPQFRVVESGSARSNDRPYTSGDEFAIRRARGVVSYWYNGEKLQDSFETSEGEVSVGCAIYMSGDVLPGGAGGPTPPPDPDPGEGLRFTGTVPPNYESAPFFLAAGDYVATESAAGASCDWFIRDVDSMQEVFEYATEGETVHFSMAQGANCVLVVEAYQAGGPFDITIGPDSGGGGA